jgi:hypothetical protein
MRTVGGINMTKTQRIILAIGLVFIVALGLWPPFQYRGGQYEGQHFLFSRAPDYGRIDLVRLGVGWLSIVIFFAVILLLHRVFSPRALRIVGLTLVALVVMTAGVVLVVENARQNARRQAQAVLIQQARNDLTAVTVTNPSEGHFVITNPTKWVLGASFNVDYTTPQRLILFSDNKSYWSESLRPYGQETIESYPLRYRAYIAGLLGIYELNRVELLRDVFVWAYERSCQRYVAISQSLGQPDRFRLRFRNELTEVVSNIVRNFARPTVETVTAAAVDHVPPEHLDDFVRIAVRELDNLHEGNYARFRLRPSEYQAWRESLQRA